ncbi:MAG TPA: TIGR03000 domain-containing protein [Gemmataceae bacterium]|nr:TIGR03000 domain-containing protein [Gemmataceae bacterium]
MKTSLPKWLAFLLPAALCLLTTGRCAGQPVLAGRILIGGPSNAEVDTGFGYYPSGHGFVNGYGYYSDYYYVNSPQIAIDYYKWKGPPPVAVAPVVDPGADVPATAAVLRVHVPADAEVWVSGDATTQRGEQRRFITPPLEAGRNQGYTLRARWMEGGKPVERTEDVRVHPGDRLTVDFLAPPPAIIP